jgi:hypothetical protein
MKSTRLGRLVKVKNTKKVNYPNVNDAYFAIWVKDAAGKNPKCLLFTEADLAKAELRAQKNPEDLTERSLYSLMVD